MIQSLHNGVKYETSFNRKIESINIAVDNAIPKLQANLFCTAPIYIGVCFHTKIDPISMVGEYFGLMKTAIKKESNRNPLK